MAGPPVHSCDAVSLPTHAPGDSLTNDDISPCEKFVGLREGQ